MQLKSIFTVDYEIHGNGEGSPFELMVEPTGRMLRLLEAHGARLTIMAEVAEIMRYAQVKRSTGRDRYNFDMIADQLRGAVATGHDVQLHIHPSYVRAAECDGAWSQDWGEYDLAQLPQPRAQQLIAEGKAFLEELLRPVRPDYCCFAFRAGNWAMMPSANIIAALAANGIVIDTSVFKGGKRVGLVNFDYRGAWSELRPWPADPADITRRNPAGQLWEFPIYCEDRPILAFLSPNRVYRAAAQARHPLPKRDVPQNAGEQAATARRSRLARLRSLLFGHHPWKADFNQCTSRQLIAAIERAHVRHAGQPGDLPFVLIGHSKTFNRFNEWDLCRYLRYVAERPERFGFGVFADFRGMLEMPAAGAAE